MENLARIDPEVAEAIRNGTRREGSQLEMIASENFVSEAVLEAMGTVLTNKYAEGYPGRRYYGGCEFVDVAEILAIERAGRWSLMHAGLAPRAGDEAVVAVHVPEATEAHARLARAGWAPGEAAPEASETSESSGTEAVAEG